MAISIDISKVSAGETSVSVRGTYSSGGTLANKAKFYCEGSFFGDIHTCDGKTSWSVSETKTGLSSSTTYTFTVHFYDGTTDLGSDSINITTDDPPTPPPDPPSSISTSVDGKDVDITWAKGDGAAYTHYEILDTAYSGYTTGTSLSRTMAEYDTTYTVRLWSEGSDGQLSSKVSKNFTTDPDPNPPPGPPSNLNASVTGLSVTITWSKGTNADDTYYEIVGTSHSGYTSGTSITKSVASYSTTYTYKLQSRNDYGTSSFVSSTFTTGEEPAITRPDNFSWTTAKIAGNTFSLTANEWNDFTDRINAFRVYKELSEYSFTQATTGAQFTALMFNETINAIDAMDPSTSTPSAQQAGYTAFASLLNDIVAALNSVA